MDLILSPEQTDLKNSKIKTLKILKNCNLPVVESKIITPEFFEKYYLKKEITPELEKKIREVFEFFHQENKPIFVRVAIERGFDRLLPISGSLIKFSDFLLFIKKTYDYFINNSKHPNKLGISLIVHNFIPSYAAGTIDTSLTQNQNLSLFEATYGIWEGIQSNLHDIYLVEKKSLKIIKKIISRKGWALFPTPQGDWKYQPVPPSLKTKQVVWDRQLKELARQAKFIENLYGPSRIEFIIKKMKPQESLNAPLIWHITKKPKENNSFYYEVAPLNKKVEGEIVFIGFPYVLKRIADIKRIKNIKYPNPAIYLSKEIISQRNIFLIEQVGVFAKEKKLPVIYQGGQLTHIATILRELGVEVFPINQEMIFGKEVKVIRSVL